VARAEPDGLTLMVSGIPTHVLGPAMSASIGFDPIRDFTHIAYFGGTPNALVAHPALGVRRIATSWRRRAASDGIEYVSAGFGTMGNWIAEYLAAKEKIKLIHVAYKGGAQAMLDLLAGHVKLGMLTWSSVAEHVRAGTAGRAGGHLGAAAELRAGLADAEEELGHNNFVATALVFAIGAGGACA